MHAVVVKVSISDAAASRSELQERVVPAISAVPGFVAGYWVQLDDARGTSMVVFESAEAAQAAAGRIQPPADVTIDSVEVGEVVASA